MQKNIRKGNVPAKGVAQPRWGTPKIARQFAVGAGKGNLGNQGLSRPLYGNLSQLGHHKAKGPNNGNVGLTNVSTGRSTNDRAK